MTEREWKPRGLQAGDISPMLNILRKIGADEIKSMLKSDKVKTIVEKHRAGDKVSAEAIGVDIALEIADVLLGNYHKCESDLFAFLGSLVELPKEEIAKLPLDQFAGLIVSVTQSEGFTGFTKVVSRLLK